MGSHSYEREAGGSWLFWIIVGLIGFSVVAAIGCGPTIVMPSAPVLPGDQTQTQVIGIGIGAPVPLPTPTPTPTATPAPTPSQGI